MEQHGKNTQQNVFAVIPARYHSTRLKGKLLLEINGIPLILYTVEQVKKVRNVSEVIVATDDERIRDVVLQSGNRAVMTSIGHRSGSDRIAEVAERLLPENSIVVNVQGDEPLIAPETIEKAVDALQDDDSIQMSTICTEIQEADDVLSSDVVKVVTDKNGFAMYFSRSPVPYPRELVRVYGTLRDALHSESDLVSIFRKHVGLYVYRREFLLEFTKLLPSKFEEIEMLEQLRALEEGRKIKVIEVGEGSIGVDTIEDFERVRKLIEGK